MRPVTLVEKLPVMPKTVSVNNLRSSTKYRTNMKTRLVPIRIPTQAAPTTPFPSHDLNVTGQMTCRVQRGLEEKQTYGSRKLYT